MTCTNSPAAWIFETSARTGASPTPTPTPTRRRRDAGRVGEFLRAARGGGLSRPQQYVLGELVLASVNEALADGDEFPLAALLRGGVTGDGGKR